MTQINNNNVWRSKALMSVLKEIQKGNKYSIKIVNELNRERSCVNRQLKVLTNFKLISKKNIGYKNTNVYKITKLGNKAIEVNNRYNKLYKLVKEIRKYCITNEKYRT